MTLDELCRVCPAVDLIVIHNTFNDDLMLIESHIFDSTKFIDEPMNTYWIPEEYYDSTIYNIRPLNDSQLLVLVRL